MNLRRFSGLAPLCLLAPALAAAPQETAQERRVLADMEFARSLADRFAYVDLAGQVIETIEGRGVKDSQKEALGLLKCDVFASGAKSEPSAEKRLELYDSAVEEFQTFMEGNPFSELLPRAQRSYVDLVNNYGRVLEMKLEEVVGEEAMAVRARMQEVLEDALNLTTDLISQLEGEISEADKLERYRLMLNRGQILLTLANVSEAGAFYYSRAEQTLEDLALEAGETSGGGLNAYLLLAKVKMAQSNWPEATAFAEFVVDVVMPIDPEARTQRWDDLPFPGEGGTLQSWPRSGPSRWSSPTRPWATPSRRPGGRCTSTTTCGPRASTSPRSATCPCSPARRD